MSQSSGSRTDLPIREELNRLIADINRWAKSFEQLDGTKPPASDGHANVREHEPTSSLSIKEKYELQTACESLARATQGPKSYLTTFAQSHRPLAALQYVVKFRLAQFVPQEQETSISFDDLASHAGVPVQQCRSAVRMLITCDIFQEPIIGNVAHNKHSLLLVGGGLEAALGFLTDEAFRSASCLAPAASRWHHSRERIKAPFNLAFNTDMPMFVHQSQQEPWRAERFRQTMNSMSEGGRASLEHLVRGFDWAGLAPETVVVDVGGSGGHCMRAVAAVNDSIQCIVQDIEAGLGDYESTDTFGGRIKFEVHDFFTTQSREADIYLLRWILHDYADHEAVKILQCQVSAMRPGARLLVMDSILPSPGQMSKAEERDARLTDIGMWSLLNGRERDMDAWTSLFHMAEPRFKVMNTVTPVGSALSVIELQVVDS